MNAADLAQHAETARVLMEHAGRVHRAVVERIDALLAVYDGPDHAAPLESARRYVERVEARGQRPFPDGTSIHDDQGYADNCNRSYDHVSISGPTGSLVVRYDGAYPVWDGDTLRGHAAAHVSVPAWVVTDLDGYVRYAEQTAGMVADLTRRQTEEARAVDALLDEILAGLGGSDGEGQ